MSTCDDKIAAILGTSDENIISYMKDIRKKSSSPDQFSTMVKDLDVGILLEDIDKLYDLLVEDDAINNKDQPKHLGKPVATINGDDPVAKILERELNITESVVVNFIKDMLKSTKNMMEFQKKISDLDVGITADVAKIIYDANAQSANIQDVGDSQLRWGNSLNIKNMTSNGIQNPFLNENEASEEIIEHSIYKGRVRNITHFGCFVTIPINYKKATHGLVHISQMSDRRINSPNEVVKQGDLVWVRVTKIQPDGKISLSMKNINQLSGKEENSTRAAASAVRGRTENKPTNIIKRRKLTSPERWEIQQLIASGAASLEDYPELIEDMKDSRIRKITNQESPSNVNQTNSNLENGEEDGSVDIELNTNRRPDFLKNEVKNNPQKFELPKATTMPKGSMRRMAMNESKLVKSHREEKLNKKKELEQELRKYRTTDDPTMNPEDVKRKIKDLKDQLVLTAWERTRMGQKIKYGKRSSKPISVQRQSLPIYKMRSELVQAVKDNQFLVIVGETGSGKTTQITQYLHDEGLADNGIIGCTQPRRVAAVSVAKRVAEEFGCQLGEEVGYTIRFEDLTSPKTSIKYMTDGILQIEALNDPIMSKYSVIMLDEAHERTVATDVLFALLKQAVKNRPDLKVIITSATLDSAKFSQYFDNCPIVNIPGKTFPVEVLYSDTPNMDYIETALDTVMQIHINEGAGDILVFLTGQEEIDACCEILYARVKELGDVIGDMIILPIYSALPSEVQSKIFEKTPEGSRKVVFATNIAETSITIDGIYFVIDPGFSKFNTYNPRVGMEQLIVSPISQAQANQRKGRAGRTGPGKCYRLYTETAFFNEMIPTTIPEIQRQNLSHTILMLKGMGIKDLLSFDFMDPPPRNLLISALEELYHLEALDTEGAITALGHKMSQFPMEPALSRTLLTSVSKDCSEEITIIISMLSVQNIFYRPKEKQQEADQKKARFFHPYGDHLTLLNVFNRWKQSNYSEQFCTINFLHYRHLKKARDIKEQLTLIFGKMKLTMTTCHGDPELVRKTLVSGFFMNAAKRDSQEGYKTVVGNTAVGIHPSSALYGKEYDYVIYHSLVLTSREYMSQVSSIEPEWLLEVASHFYKKISADSVSRKRIKIEPLFDKYSKDQNSWRLSSIRQAREKALGIKR